MRGLDFSRRIGARAVNSTYMLALATLALACAPEGSLGRGLVTGTGDGSTATATAADGSSGSTGTATSDGSSTASTSSDSGSTTAPAVCPPEAPDTACATCTKGHCCAEWLACEASDACTCIETCIADGNDPTGCSTTHCGGPDDDWIHLHDCRAELCLDVC